MHPKIHPLRAPSQRKVFIFLLNRNIFSHHIAACSRISDFVPYNAARIGFHSFDQYRNTGFQCFHNVIAGARTASYIDQRCIDNAFMSHNIRRRRCCAAAGYYRRRR